MMGWQDLLELAWVSYDLIIETTANKDWYQSIQGLMVWWNKILGLAVQVHYNEV